VKYLLDTCLISELVKKEPNPGVVNWLDEQDEQTLFLSVLNLGELQKGISKLPEGTKKDELQAWIGLDLVERFTGRILDIDLDTALCWGRIQGEAEQEGLKLPVMDSAHCRHRCGAWIDCRDAECQGYGEMRREGL